MENKQWEIKTLGGGQLSDTGDYDDPYYELTNGDISLITKDDLDDFKEDDRYIDVVVEALNQLGAKWENWKQSDIEFQLHLLEKDYKVMRKIAETLLKELKWATECCYEETTSAENAIGIVSDCENQLNMLS